MKCIIAGLLAGIIAGCQPRVPSSAGVGYSAFDSVQVKAGLTNPLFDQPFDTVTDPATQDKLVINANCLPSHSPPTECDQEVIPYCNCYLANDTLRIIIDQSYGCYNRLLILVTNNRFTTTYECNTTVSPAKVTFAATRQELTVDQRKYREGDLLKGYITFAGRGSYSQPYQRLSNKERRRVFTGTVA
jgi:hypothetical protein